MSSPKNHDVIVMDDKILGLLVVCHPRSLLAEALEVHDDRSNRQ
jgi:hypothetical protein